MATRKPGSIYQRTADHMWVVAIDLAPHPDGRRNRKVVVRKKKAVRRDMGMIQRARASLTVVAICNASGPYLPAAPTTELVSCIAMALHKPNWSCERWRR